MSVAIGSSATGARTYTATASQGILFMAEAVYNASDLGLPIVMTVANRALGAPINIRNDHTDALSQRDSGWIQLFAETNQEALDLHIQAFKLAALKSSLAPLGARSVALSRPGVANSRRGASRSWKTVMYVWPRLLAVSSTPTARTLA